MSLKIIIEDFKNLLKEILKNIDKFNLEDKQLEISTKIDAVLYLLNDDSTSNLVISEVIKIVRDKEADAMLISILNYENKYDLILIKDGLNKIFSDNFEIDAKIKNEIGKYSFIKDVILSQLFNITDFNNQFIESSFSLIRNFVKLISSKYDVEKLKKLTFMSLHIRYTNFIEQLCKIIDKNELKTNIIPFFIKLDKDERDLLLYCLDDYIKKKKEEENVNFDITKTKDIKDYLSKIGINVYDDDVKYKKFCKIISVNVKKYFNIV